MLPDLMTAVPVLVSILGTLGIASVIAQWFASGKDRRTTRAAVLTELAAVESARWYSEGEQADNQRLRQAIRLLETAALVARVPRRAVVPYFQLSMAALWYTDNEVEKWGANDQAAGSTLPSEFYEIVQDAAGIVSRAAWSSPTNRLLWLRWQLCKLDRRIAAVTESEITSRIKRAREFIR